MRAGAQVRSARPAPQPRALLREVAGFERANWFATGGAQARYEYSHGRQNWFEQSAGASGGARTGRTVRSVSFANSCSRDRRCRVLGRICANDIDVPVGRVA